MIHARGPAFSRFSSPEDLAIHALSELSDVAGEADILMRAEHAVDISRQAETVPYPMATPRSSPQTSATRSFTWSAMRAGTSQESRTS